MSEHRFYRVTTDFYHLRVPDPHLHGYETEREFRRALQRLAGHWKGRVGERIGERNGFWLLRFHDTPGGRPDEAWLPTFLLLEVKEPPHVNATAPAADESNSELDGVFGFDK